MKKYMLQLLIPVFIAILCVSSIVLNPNGLNLDVDFKGGTEISISSSTPYDITAMKDVLKEYEVNIKVASGLSGYTTLVGFDASIDPTAVVNALKENGFQFEKYSVQSMSPLLSESFFKQAQLVLLISFIFMSLVIIFIFKSPLIGFYIGLCPALDIIETLALTQILGFKLSLAGFAALVMIIGYSVDGDVIIATRALKRTDIPMAERFKASLKTSLTMHLTTMVALSALFLLSTSAVMTQIAIFLLIGLAFDLMNTWLLDANLLRWHVDRKGVK